MENLEAATCKERVVTIRLAPGKTGSRESRKWDLRFPQLGAKNGCDRGQPDHPAVGRNLPADVSLPPHRRSRDPAQAPAEDLLPGLRRRPRGAAGGRGHGAPARLRLVFPLLSRSRAVPGARRHALRHVPAVGWRGAAIRPAAAARCRPTGAAARCTSSAHRPRRRRSYCTPWAAPRPAAISAAIPRQRPGPQGDYRAFHDVEFHGDEVVLACVGEGSTSQGEFWEALNTASNQKLPVIFCVEDNGYAISVPVEVNTPGGNISPLVANFPNFHFAEVDGTDPVACLRAFQEAAAHCRAGRGPAFVHGHCIRPYSHSLSDDDKLYRSAAEREADALRDPIARMQTAAAREGGVIDRQSRSTLWSSRWSAKWPRPPSARSKRRCRGSRSFPSTSTLRISTPPARLCDRAGAGRRGSQGKKALDGATHHGRPHQRLPARRDAPRPAHRGLRRRRGRRQPRAALC